jgi:PAS domain S-box-containing protein
MFWADQNAVLERVAAGHPLGEILNDIVAMIERQAAGMLCSLLLLDSDGETIRHGAAPSLPADYARHLDGLKIGPTAGSCGTAAYRGERVIVEDIAAHPYWDSYRHLALPCGLRACWSSPIFSPEREVLGTFAMYYRQPHRPTPDEIRWVDVATHLAAIAIVSERAVRSLRQSEKHARHLARLHAMSSAINEAIVRERDVDQLYRTACRIAVDHGLARLAWIGHCDLESRRMVPAAHAGEAFERVFPAHLERDAHDPGGSLVQTVLRGGSVICNDIAADPHVSWKDVADAHGLGSYAVIPMRHRAPPAGTLVIYSEQRGAFGAEEMKVLAALAEDIAFAVDSARMAAALRQSEQRLRAVIEHTPDVAIQWYDESGRIFFYNEASRRLFGWSQDGALGKTLLELGFWSRTEEARFRQARAQAAAGHQVAPMHYGFVRRDGSEGVLLSTVFRIPLAECEHCYVCMDVDLSDFRRMEEAVGAGERLRALIYDSVSDVIFYIAVEGEERYRFQSVNRAFLSATGLRESDVVGRAVDEVVPPTSWPLVKAKYAEAIASRAKVVWEEVSRYPSGLKYGEVTVSPLFDAQGRCTHLLGSVHDVTERREAEQTRRQIEAELHRAQRLQAIGTLAGGIAHDFRNILTAVHGNVDLMLATNRSGSEARECLLEVKQAADRASDLVGRILTFGGKNEPRPERLELAPVIEEALKLIRSSLRGIIQLRSTFAPDTPPIRGDSTQIHQVVLNLVTNARQAIGDNSGLIELRLEVCEVGREGRGDAPELAEGRYARLTVSDSGSGMDAYTARRAFEPFFTTKPPGEGTGLGLSVVHGIVESHGGVVRVQSKPGQGTTFELFFPACDKPRTARRRVLFVDDDQAVVFLARRAFSNLGFEVSAHVSSVDALDEFRRRPTDFDVVVTDLTMADLDGLGLIRQLRQIRPDTRIVVTSSAVRPEDVAQARALGVSEIFDKPQSVGDLARLIQLRGA